MHFQMKARDALPHQNLPQSGLVEEEALVPACKTLNRMYANRFIPFLPDLLETREKQGHIQLSQEHLGQLLLTPGLGRRPLPIGTIDVNSEDWQGEFRKAGVFTPFTAVWNTTGQPAISTMAKVTCR